jgi:hypothetical protein
MRKGRTSLLVLSEPSGVARRPAVSDGWHKHKQTVPVPSVAWREGENRILPGIRPISARKERNNREGFPVFSKQIVFWVAGFDGGPQFCVPGDVLKVLSKQ